MKNRLKNYLKNDFNELGVKLESCVLDGTSNTLEVAVSSDDGRKLNSCEIVKCQKLVSEVLDNEEICLIREAYALDVYDIQQVDEINELEEEIDDD